MGTRRPINCSKTLIRPCVDTEPFAISARPWNSLDVTYTVSPALKDLHAVWSRFIASNRDWSFWTTSSGTMAIVLSNWIQPAKCFARSIINLVSRVRAQLTKRYPGNNGASWLFAGRLGEGAQGRNTSNPDSWISWAAKCSDLETVRMIYQLLTEAPFSAVDDTAFTWTI